MQQESLWKRPAYRLPKCKQQIKIVVEILIITSLNSLSNIKKINGNAFSCSFLHNLFIQIDEKKKSLISEKAMSLLFVTLVGLVTVTSRIGRSDQL